MSEEIVNSDDENLLIKPTVSFAPADPTDGRKLGAWQTRYVPQANKIIRYEALYLGILLVLMPIVIVSIHQDFYDYIIVPSVIKKFSYAWIGGTLGGVLFSIKWLYHSVARNLWNQDRLLWRIFTPHISGALAFSFIILISSGIISLFSPSALEKNTAVFGLSFLVGYFSDSAIAKLNEVANTIFGATQKDDPKKQPDTNPDKLS